MVTDCPGYSREFDPTQMFKTILVPVDFSPESRRALITACEARRRFGSDIHVFTHYEAHTPQRRLEASFDYEDAAQDANRCLEFFGKSICNGTPCILKDASSGEDVVHGVVKTAREINATLVIMGLHQKHTLFRSRAERIMRSLDIPVLLLQGETVLPVESDRKAFAHADR